jgi:hypothetical protein
MIEKTAEAPQFRDLPLWRLLVALADAERAFGPTHPTTRRIAEVVQERLAQAEADTPNGQPRKGMARG